MPSPTPLDNSDNGEGQVAVRELNESGDNTSDEANVVADNNNVGENNNDLSDSSSDDGLNEAAGAHGSAQSE